MLGNEDGGYQANINDGNDSDGKSQDTSGQNCQQCLNRMNNFLKYR